MKHAIYQTIRGRLVMLITTLILILSISAVTFSYAVFYNNLKDATKLSTKSSLEFISKDLDTKLNELNRSLFWCRTNKQITDFALENSTSNTYSKTASKAKTLLDEELFYNPASGYIVRLIVGSLNKETYIQATTSIYSVDQPMTRIIRKLPDYESSMRKDRFDLASQIQPDPFLSYELPAIPVVRPIYNPYNVDVIGFVYLELNISLFEDAFREYIEQDNNPVYLTLSGHTYRFTANGYDEVSPPSTRNLITVDLSTSDCSISQELSPNALQQHYTSYLLLVLCLLIGILLIGLLLFVSLSRLVNAPVRQLNRRLAKIATGDFTFDSSIEWNNEFGDIGRNVNQLSSAIDSLMKTRIADEKEKKDYEYKMLQSQINPHFLYNTLNSIKWMATIQNSPGIAEMVTSLSRLLKNIAKGKDSIVTIQEELALLDDYFLIQKYRYGGTITLNYEIEDDKLLSTPILRFTLQPIVENAIFHGIEPKGQNGHIVIHIFLNDEHQVQIDITDDGVGMDEQKRQELLSTDTHDKANFFQDVGISSVNKRLTYTFGDVYGITIQSEVGKFTTMSIKIPYVESER